LSWLAWTRRETNADLLGFAQHCIAFRHAHPVLRSRDHYRNSDYVGSGYADISWHGTQAWNADWSAGSRVLAFMLCGKHAKAGGVEDNYIYVAMNMHWEALPFDLPGLPTGMAWHVFANTSMTSPEDSYAPGREPRLSDQSRLIAGGRSVIILVGR